jgi:hypothetical protein
MTTSSSAWRSKLERFGTNLFLLTILIMFSLDAWPSEWVGGNTMSEIQQRIDPFLDVTGLWQGPWYLFAPKPPTENVYITATLLYLYKKADGTQELDVQTWRSPNWEETTWLQKKRLFRMQEYIDSIRNDVNKDVWKPLAEHLARTETIEVDGKILQPNQIQLIRHWRNIHGPEAVQEWPESHRHWLLGDRVQSTLSEEAQYQFFQWNRPESWEF